MTTLINLSPAGVVLLVALLVMLAVVLLMWYCYANIKADNELKNLEIEQLKSDLQNRQDRVAVQSKVIEAFVRTKEAKNEMIAQMCMLLNPEQLQQLLEIVVSAANDGDLGQKKACTEIKQCLQKAIATYGTKTD